jgi:hypothetical protein
VPLPSGYRSLDDVVAALHDLAAASPAGRIAPIGAGALGEPLFAVELGPPAARRVTAILAGTHALEWIGVEVMLALLGRLAAAPPTDRRILAIPVLNPDGYRQVERDLLAGKRRFRRSNGGDIDLNRNWPTHFRVRPSRTLASPGWSGPAPLSAPELRAAAAALDGAAAVARLDLALSLHSFGRKILVPWGGRWRRPAAAPRLVAAARAVQARIGERYDVVQCSRWLPGAFAHGTELDHLHARYDATTLLVECSRGGIGRDPRALLEPFRWYNPRQPAPIAADLARALEPFVRGLD